MRLFLRLYKYPKSIPKPIFRKKGRATSDLKTGTLFVDQKYIETHGGKGGDGCVSFAHIFRNPYAGPDGGNGGCGAHVVFEACEQVKCLANIPSIVKGKPGGNGRGSNCDGKNADPLVIKVPVGTIFKNTEGDIVADLSRKTGSIFLAARGGAGGKGNSSFASPSYQSPEIAEYGGDGEVRKYYAELSSIAHFGLVGYPNAGKSTLLRAISRARPKVANYPFTTLRPHVGVVMYDDLEQISVADIPGIIEDAHKNRGLGISFLRHIQRCLCLIYIIDISQPEPWEQLVTLKNELNHYNPDLTNRASIILANKIDMDEAKSNLEEFKKRVDPDLFVIPMSAKDNVNIMPFLEKIRHIYDQSRNAEIKTNMATNNEHITTVIAR